MFGDLNSGKTTLANALEDFNSQSNLIEQMEIKSDKTESKFIFVLFTSATAATTTAAATISN